MNRPDESKLSSVRFLLSPLVWLRQPCADFIGVPRGRGWGRESGVVERNSWKMHSPKGFSLRRGSAAGGGEV